MENDAAQESLQIFYEWLQEMSMAESELALKGIEAYLDDLQTERDIEQGWHRGIDGDT